MTAVLLNLNKLVELQTQQRPTTTFLERLNRFNWPLLALALLISSIGLFNQYVIGQITPTNLFSGAFLTLSHRALGLPNRIAD